MTETKDQAMRDQTSAIDLHRYPISAIADGRGRELVYECRNDLADRGYCELPGFVTERALAQLVGEAVAASPHAHRHSGLSTPYLEIPADHWPEGHPRVTAGSYSLGAVAYDLIPEGSEMRRLYESDVLLHFLAACLGEDRLYRYADPLGACNFAVMCDGDELEWHFDQTDFVVSIALQRPLSGGDFECVPRVRSIADERYDDVAATLAGSENGLVRVPFEPGSMLLFQGRYSMHRVSRVHGGNDRLVALLSYDTQPGTVSSPLLQASRYGRVARP